MFISVCFLLLITSLVDVELSRTWSTSLPGLSIGTFSFGPTKFLSSIFPSKTGVPQTKILTYDSEPSGYDSQYASAFNNKGLKPEAKGHYEFQPVNRLPLEIFTFDYGSQPLYKLPLDIFTAQLKYPDVSARNSVPALLVSTASDLQQTNQAGDGARYESQVRSYHGSKEAKSWKDVWKSRQSGPNQNDINFGLSYSYKPYRLNLQNPALFKRKDKGFGSNSAQISDTSKTSKPFAYSTSVSSGSWNNEGSYQYRLNKENGDTSFNSWNSGSKNLKIGAPWNNERSLLSMSSSGNTFEPVSISYSYPEKVFPEFGYGNYRATSFGEDDPKSSIGSFASAITNKNGPTSTYTYKLERNPSASLDFKEKNWLENFPSTSISRVSTTIASKPFTNSTSVSGGSPDKEGNYPGNNKATYYQYGLNNENGDTSLSSWSSGAKNLKVGAPWNNGQSFVSMSSSANAFQPVSVSYSNPDNVFPKFGFGNYKATSSGGPDRRSSIGSFASAITNTNGPTSAYTYKIEQKPSASFDLKENNLLENVPSISTSGEPFAYSTSVSSGAMNNREKPPYINKARKYGLSKVNGDVSLNYWPHGQGNFKESVPWSNGRSLISFSSSGSTPKTVSLSYSNPYTFYPEFGFGNYRATSSGGSTPWSSVGSFSSKSTNSPTLVYTDRKKSKPSASLNFINDWFGKTPSNGGFAFASASSSTSSTPMSVGISVNQDLWGTTSDSDGLDDRFSNSNKLLSTSFGAFGKVPQPDYVSNFPNAFRQQMALPFWTKMSLVPHYGNLNRKDTKSLSLNNNNKQDKYKSESRNKYRFASADNNSNDLLPTTTEGKDNTFLSTSKLQNLKKFISKNLFKLATKNNPYRKKPAFVIWKNKNDATLKPLQTQRTENNPRAGILPVNDTRELLVENNSEDSTLTTARLSFIKSSGFGNENHNITSTRDSSYFSTDIKNVTSPADDAPFVTKTKF